MPADRHTPPASTVAHEGGKERPVIFSAPMVRAILSGRKTMTRRLATSPLRKCEPGDLLWVREAWKPHSIYAGMKPRDVPDTQVFYRADDKYAPSNTPWIPSIHMPRWASRVALRVAGIKIERLQDISYEDCRDEGTTCPIHGDVSHVGCSGLRRGFRALWDSLHGDGAWDANPEVVAVSFERVP